jgi:signal transduction histidine kinase
MNARLSLRRLFATFVGLAVVTVLVSAVGLVLLRWAIGAKEQVIARFAGAQVSVAELSALSERRARKLRSYLLTGEHDFARERAQALDEFDGVLSELEQNVGGPEEQQLLEAVRDANAHVLPVVARLVSMKENARSDDEIATTLLLELQPARNELDAAVERLVEAVALRNQLDAARANRRVAAAVTILGSTVALALIAAMVLGFVVYRAMQELHAEQAELERAARYQQEVMGIVGHDVRSPLAAIITTASLAASDSRSKEEERSMHRILRSARRIDALAGTLLDIARLRLNGRLPVVPQPGDVHELIAEQIEQMGSRCGTCTLEHERSGDGGVSFDWDRLSQVVQILLEQCLAHAERGSTVRASSRGEDKAVVIEVSARSAPIADVLLGRMFEPFAQADAHAEPVQLSRGFGLYVARELVSAHHGTIDVRSEGQGIAFRVHLPRRADLGAPAMLPHNLAQRSA